MSAPGAAHVCAIQYVRTTPPGAYPLVCTFLINHDGPCSWQDVKDADAAALSGATAATSGEAMDLASEVLAGRFDAYLELILNAAHNRKRALRGVRGFPR